jgi:hypothetical protein
MYWNDKHYDMTLFLLLRSEVKWPEINSMEQKSCIMWADVPNASSRFSIAQHIFIQGKNSWNTPRTQSPETISRNVIFL